MQILAWNISERFFLHQLEAENNFAALFTFDTDILSFEGNYSSFLKRFWQMCQICQILLKAVLFTSSA